MTARVLHDVELNGVGVKEIAAFADHGGQLDVARWLFPNAPEPWLDLSTGMNAVAYPIGKIPVEAWTRLPDEARLNALEAAAARRYFVPPGSSVMAAPGTQAIIQRLPVVCKGRDVRILGPTYGEFERVFRSFDRIVRVVPKFDALYGADVAVVVNPNNPDGRQVSVPDLTALSARVGTLVVDEAFADALPSSHSIIPRLASAPVVVLRSFGKIYGLAGLRLGFAVASTARIEKMRTLVGPWPISGPALHIGAAALSDDTWLAEARSRLETDAARLMFLLRQIGAQPVGGTPLFRLIAHPAGPALFRTLAQAGILTRPFVHERNWLRFGFPETSSDWTRLEAALLSFS